MSAPPPPTTSNNSNPEPQDQTPVRPLPTAVQVPPESAAASTSTLRAGSTPQPPGRKKRNNHTGGKKKRTRRQSFAAPSEDGAGLPETSANRDTLRAQNAARSSFYRLQGHNTSNTSIESSTLLDHRDQPSTRPRRSSTLGLQSSFSQFESTSSPYRSSYANPFVAQENASRNSLRPRTTVSRSHSDDEADENAPLLSASKPKPSASALSKLVRRDSSRSSLQSRKTRKATIFDRQQLSFPGQESSFNVNYPPSVPASPELGAVDRELSFGDMLTRDDFESQHDLSRIDNYGRASLDSNAIDDGSAARDPTPRDGFEPLMRRHTIAFQAEEDVCFPIEGMSEIGEEEMRSRGEGPYRGDGPAPRKRGRRWPDLAMLDEWSRFEKEGRSEERRAKRITEPQLIGGRLRPVHKGWHRAEDDAPYRFTYFNDDLQSTIHSQTISELVQVGGTFKELFIPDPPELSDSEDSEVDEEPLRSEMYRHASVHAGGANGESRVPTRQGSILDDPRPASRIAGSVAGERQTQSKEGSGEATPSGVLSPGSKAEAPFQPERTKRYGDRPAWWLDILSPTEAEMKVISKTFGIHPLTAEDIMMQEAREKVELFRHYYFVNYRSFEQDMNNEDFLEPVNMYVIVFREGVLSFHFSMTPHPANVRRRIRQLKDYMFISSDWISYAIIDDITDVFAPLIQNIEDEVDDIDDSILQLHSPSNSDSLSIDEKRPDSKGDQTTGESGGDMLRRVGDCRKKVMGLYRLLGNKADVIKGFAKRCNEHWEVAPRSEIGLYLGDIQDHIVTMTGNLSHYEKILARSHGNYLAQINIRMNERQEQTADVLGRLTVLGTIVLPMNIITGLWGMNVWVPGQADEGNLTWFWCLTAGLLVFGLSCFYIAKLVYRIV